MPLAVTYLYINLPVALFYFFWLRAPWGWIAFLLFVAYSFYQIVSIRSDEYNFRFTWPEVLMISGLCVILIVVSGISGVGGASTFDTSHHIQKVFDFSSSDPPIYYKNAAAYASYYYGFYIVPGLLLNSFGNITAVFFLWQFFGMFIGLSWLYLLLNRNYLHLILLFLVSGLLSFLAPLFRLDNFLFSPYFYFQDTQWNLLPMYLSLRWVPNQFIYTAILTGVIMYLKPRHLVHGSTLLISGLFWAPFPTLIMGVIYLIRVIPVLVKEKTASPSIFLVTNAFLVSFIFLYLIANQTSNSWEFSLTGSPRILNYISLVCFEILIFYGLTEPRFRQKTELKVALGILVLLPLVKLGAGNDLFSRASLPLLLILYIYFVKSLSYKTGKWPYRIVVMVLVSLLPLKYIGDNIRKFSLEPFYVPSEQIDTYSLIKKDYQKQESGRSVPYESQFLLL
ncbi:MAG: hypothetical protein LRY55_03475 [Leadbetterella sp.]|nr:hypothetical protein [Leadbetterella sp.]